MEFEISKERPSIIKVIGVGGGGSNAVNHMYHQGIRGVDFMICNTDAQALEISPVPFKIQLGPSLTEGRGAGSLPEVGKNAAIENIEEIQRALAKDIKMVFITAGMGGGTGTGAAPIIAGVAKEMGILTVGIVTVPFAFEGKKRKLQANTGIEELKKSVDTLLIISNDKLREIHGDLKLTEAFGRADDILTIAARSIAEIITVTGYINVDFADVQTVLKDSGVAIMGCAFAEGTERAKIAAQLVLDSPLLNDSNINGARYILLNITSGKTEVTMDEIGEITDYIQEQAGLTADIIMGTGTDATLGDKIAVTVIATGFKTHTEIIAEKNKPIRVVHTLDNKTETPKEKPVTNMEPTLINDNPVEPDKPAAPKSYEYARASALNKPLVTEEKNNTYEKPSHLTVTDTEGTMSFEFDLTTSVEQTAPPEVNTINETYQEAFTLASPVENVTDINTASIVPTADEEEAATSEDQFKKTRERIMKLRELSYKFQSSNSNVINDLEKEPAYKRRNVQLANVPDSSESQVSRLTLGENENKNVEIKSNNTFLHDRVD
ncbi:MAG: cell division protein FtsZ [Bacteroidia bacterium]